MTHDSIPKAPDDHELPGDPDTTTDDDTREMLHQLRTPLTIISGYVQLLRRRNHRQEDGQADGLERSLHAIESAVDRMRDIIGERHDPRDEGP